MYARRIGPNGWVAGYRLSGAGARGVSANENPILDSDCYVLLVEEGHANLRD